MNILRLAMRTGSLPFGRIQRRRLRYSFTCGSHVPRHTFSCVLWVESTWKSALPLRATVRSRSSNADIHEGKRMWSGLSRHLCVWLGCNEAGHIFLVHSPWDFSSVGVIPLLITEEMEQGKLSYLLSPWQLFWCSDTSRKHVRCSRFQHLNRRKSAILWVILKVSPEDGITDLSCFLEVIPFLDLTSFTGVRTMMIPRS